MDDTHAYILTDCEGGVTLFQLQGVGGNVPHVVVDLGRQPKSVKCSPHHEVVIRPCHVLQVHILIGSFFVNSASLVQ